MRWYGRLAHNTRTGSGEVLSLIVETFLTIKVRICIKGNAFTLEVFSVNRKKAPSQDRITAMKSNQFEIKNLFYTL